MEFNRSNLIVRLKSIDFGNRLNCRNECDLVLPVSRVCTESWILEIKKSCNLSSNFPDLEIVWKMGIKSWVFFSKLQQVLLKWNLVCIFAEYEKGFVPAFFKVFINHLFDNLESGKRDYCLEKSMEKVLNFGSKILYKPLLSEWQINLSKFAR